VREVVLADTGPLVAFLVRKAQHHGWAFETMGTLRPPLLTCEPVLAEAAHILRRHGCDTDPLFALIERGVLNIAFSVESELVPLRQLMRRYRVNKCPSPTPASSSAPNSMTSRASGPSTPTSASIAASGG
jgi:hypothetical protein